MLVIFVQGFFLLSVMCNFCEERRLQRHNNKCSAVRNCTETQ